MRERSYNNPQPAMLVHSAQGYSTAPANAFRQSPSFASNANAMRYTPAAAYRVRGPAGSCGCGSSGCCGCGSGGPRTFPPARYDEDGSCASLFDISCETQWRVRECFKIAICDLLRCLGEELCEDGRFVQDPDLGACLERFVCSILTCLPEAICPSGGEEICCLPAQEVSCGCNFAVGE